MTLNVLMCAVIFCFVIQEKNVVELRELEIQYINSLFLIVKSESKRVNENVTKIAVKTSKAFFFPTKNIPQTNPQRLSQSKNPFPGKIYNTELTRLRMSNCKY